MTRVFLIFTSAFLFALPAVVPAAPVPQRKPLLYFPTTEAKWVYRFYGVNDAVGRDVVEVVMCVKVLEGGTHVALGSVFDGKPAQASGEAFIVTPKGLRRGYVTQDGSVASAVEVLRVPCIADETWVLKRDQFQADKEQRYTSRGPEDVEVPAGKFHAIRVDVEYVWRNGNPSRKDRVWYAPGVGVVKWEDDEGRSKVLKSFEAGK